MGCDIHHVLERRVDSTDRDGEIYRREWFSCGELDLGRHYEFFAVIAGVRNYNNVPVIADPKGMPGWKSCDQAGRWHAWDWSEQPSQAFRDYYEAWYGDAHSATWLTLAEVKAFDIDQEVYDDGLIVGRSEAGAVTAVARSTTGPHEGEVGRRKLLRWPGQEEPTAWLTLIAALERAKWDDQADDAVRLVCFFDN